MESFIIFIIVLIIVAIIIIVCKIISAKESKLEAKYNQRLAEYEKLCEEQEKLCEEQEKLCEEQEKLCEEQKKLKEYYEKLIRDFDKIIEKKCEYYPALAAIMADILTLYYERSARYLETKTRPAKLEAYRIRELRDKTKKILEEKKYYEYQLAYVKSLYPDIDDVIIGDEDNISEDIQDIRLSDEEYNNLTETQKNQLALDRYIQGRKSKWQIGRDYEMYVGHMYENGGYTVEYNGISEKLEDMGRDLIAVGGTNIMQ